MPRLQTAVGRGTRGGCSKSNYAMMSAGVAWSGVSGRRIEEIDVRTRTEQSPRDMVRRFRKLIKFAAVTLGILFVSIIGLAIVLALWPDASPPKDAAMLPVPKPNSGNGPLADFEVWLDQQAFTKQEGRLRLAKFKEPWSGTEAQSLLKEKAAVLEKYAAFAATDAATWSWKDAPKLTLGESFGSTEKFTFLLGLETVSVREQIELGNYTDAGKQAHRLIAAGLGLRKAEGCLIHLLVANMFLKRGLDCFEEIARKNGGSAEEWKAWQGVIAKSEPNASDFLEANKVEYLAFKRMIVKLSRGEQINYAPSQEIHAPVVKRFFLKPNATAELYLELSGIVQKGVEARKWLAAKEAFDQVYHRIVDIKSNLGVLFVSTNSVGKIVVTLALPATKPMVESEFKLMARTRSAACVVAMHRFNLEMGRMPSSLADLVPTYLDAVPSDPFTEQPLKCSAANETVYSVGADLKDDNGAIDEEKSWRSKDVGSANWWRKTSDK